MPEAQLGSAVVLTYRKPQPQQLGNSVVLNYNAGAEDPYFVSMFGESRGRWGKSRLSSLSVESKQPKTGVISEGPQSPWGMAVKLKGDVEVPWEHPNLYQVAKDAPWTPTQAEDVPEEGITWSKAGKTSGRGDATWDGTTPLADTGGSVIVWGKSKESLQSIASVWAIAVPLRRRSEVWCPWGIAFPASNEGKYPWDRKAPSHDRPWVIVYPSGPVTDEHGTIIIKVKRAYIMQNDITIRTVAGGVTIPVLALRMSIDRDTWAWGFNATVPMEYLPELKSSGLRAPIEILVSVNGDDFLMIVESVSRSREFGKSALTISGRGHSAYLSDPYSPVRTFSSTESRTCRQLFEEALTFNSAPLGWTVNWNIPDWVVPPGVWSHTGTYISAITAIANSVGASIYPDPRLKELNVNSKFPTLPSEWASIAPYMVLPTAVVQTEGIEWVEKPAYNGIYISGEAGGVLGFARKDGTIGDYLAEQYSHALITHADAVREKARSVLADTGFITNVTLSLPILDSSGLIPPGNVIKYQDGSEALYGITRSLSVNASGAKARQTILVEVH